MYLASLVGSGRKSEKGTPLRGLDLGLHVHANRGNSSPECVTVVGLIPAQMS